MIMDLAIRCSRKSFRSSAMESHICQNRADMGHPSFVTGTERRRKRSLLRFPQAGNNVALAVPAQNPDFLYAPLDETAYAAFVKESRKKRAGATNLHRKSREARDQSRDSFTER